MIYQQQPIEGTQMVLWGDPKEAKEVHVTQSVRDAAALWSVYGSKKTGVLVISAPKASELALLLQNPSNN